MSIKLNQKLSGRLRRKVRVRKRVFGTPERPRMNVFRSASHIYVQVIDDVSGVTLASASTLGKAAPDASGKKIDKAKRVGLLVASECKKKNIEAVVFDRNGFRYHGRVRAVAEAAREGGLKF